ncbi:TIGR04282 family arsenosugar biosynthesis glycosyltransferase [Psychroserpens sp. XS_ASV72]|uniref:TIGR04282 family arsenosugar biosynthesis glycosyltransferase n=1 Tax=Psychroserpens sp. XS_ASV72 TaxID=3241293 RepID=UPI00351819B7
MNTNALMIFTRNPELGQCKTRLAKTIGDQAALDIYKHLLKHTAEVAKHVDADKHIFYSEMIIENDLWTKPHFFKQLQEGSDLGQRMQNAFDKLFDSGYKNIIIIGSDLMDLKANIIALAFENLQTNDVVIGPAEDGGYYLLGMKKRIPSIFKNKLWGTDSVLKDTLKDLQNLKIFQLKELNDIDTFEDLKPYHQLKPFYNSHD